MQVPYLYEKCFNICFNTKYTESLSNEFSLHVPIANQTCVNNSLLPLYASSVIKSIKSCWLSESDVTNSDQV